MFREKGISTKILVIVVVVVIAIIGGTGWYTLSIRGKEKVEKIKIGSAVKGDFALTAPVVVAQEKDFFEDEGVKVDFITFKGGPDMTKTLAAGEIQMGVTGISDLFVFGQRGASITMVASYTDEPHMTFTIDPKIEQLEELKGEKIGATSPGSFTYTLCTALIEDLGMEPGEDVERVGLGGLSSQIAALKKDKIAGYWFGDLGAAVAEAKGVGKLGLTAEEILPQPWHDQPLLANNDFVKNNPEVIKDVMRALQNSWEWQKNHPDETISIMSEYLDLPESTVRRSYEIVKPRYPKTGRIKPEAIDVMHDFVLEYKMISEPIEDLSKLYTNEFIP